MIEVLGGRLHEHLSYFVLFILALTHRLNCGLCFDVRRVIFTIAVARPDWGNISRGTIEIIIAIAEIGGLGGRIASPSKEAILILQAIGCAFSVTLLLFFFFFWLLFDCRLCGCHHRQRRHRRLFLFFIFLFLCFIAAVFCTWWEGEFDGLRR